MNPPYKHLVYQPGLDPGAENIVISGDEAKHAIRVKRAQVGHRVGVVDGKGLLLIAEVIGTGRDLELRVERRSRVDPPTPRIELFSAVPKGPRSGDLINGVSQAGADRWSPLVTAFAVESATPAKYARWERIAAESLKQCGRGWLLELGEPAALPVAVAPAEGVDVVIADAGGERYEPVAAATVRVLVGPEGGWRADELDAAVGSGARRCCFGPYVMRVETAAVVATAVVRHAAPRA